jgi:hypothetical protein
VATTSPPLNYPSPLQLAVIVAELLSQVNNMTFGYYFLPHSPGRRKISAFHLLVIVHLTDCGFCRWRSPCYPSPTWSLSSQSSESFRQNPAQALKLKNLGGLPPKTTTRSETHKQWSACTINQHELLSSQTSECFHRKQARGLNSQTLECLLQNPA